MDEFLGRFRLSKEDYKHLKSLSLAELDQVQEIFTENYNANGELRALEYIKNTRYLDEKMIDGINPGGVETAILDDPYRLSVFIPEFPLRLKQYAKTKFSKTLGFETAGRWQNYMVVALRELRAKGAEMFVEPVVINYTFHFPKENMDVDNYAIKFINDMFRYAQIIEDDSFKYASTYYSGILDKEKPGTEITVIKLVDFTKYLDAII